MGCCDIVFGCGWVCAVLFVGWDFVLCGGSGLSCVGMVGFGVGYFVGGWVWIWSGCLVVWFYSLVLCGGCLRLIVWGLFCVFDFRLWWVCGYLLYRCLTGLFCVWGFGCILVVDCVYLFWVRRV